MKANRNFYNLIFSGKRLPLRGWDILIRNRSGKILCEFKKFSFEFNEKNSCFGIKKPIKAKVIKGGYAVTFDLLHQRSGIILNGTCGSIVSIADLIIGYYDTFLYESGFFNIYKINFGLA